LKKVLKSKVKRQNGLNLFLYFLSFENVLICLSELKHLFDNKFEKKSLDKGRGLLEKDFFSKRYFWLFGCFCFVIFLFDI
jgi:hypothetical protein